MLSTRFTFKSFPSFLTVAGIFLLLFTSPAYAITFTPSGVPDIATMLINLSNDLPNFMRLITAFAYVMGFYFVVKGLMEFKHFAEMRSMMSQEHGIMKPISFLVAGSLLIYLPATVQTGLSTFWTNPTPYQYISDAADTWGQLLNAVFMVIQLIGVIAMIRGIIMLTHLGGHGGHQGGFGKALTFIVAGLLCINVYQFLQAVFSTLGLGQLS